MSGFGYTVLGFGSHPNRGPAALSISLTNNGPEILELAGAGGSTVVSNAEVVDMTAAASGGDGSYSFAWTVTELSDRGTHSIAAQGTQNAAQYNTLTIQSVLPAGGGEPVEAEYRLGCTVTDGNSDTASGQVDIVVVSFGL